MVGKKGKGEGITWKKREGLRMGWRGLGQEGWGKE